ncbi:MAG: glycerol-3-phosphate dehydrogenase/oxidase [Planctomycetes bacterium]|nr:glycerol-3-phosphate dehydrogenase/oxidase [Planctomycetota bacterium]
MKRTEMLDRISSRREPWDLIVIGGGATGAGVAVDAVSRGYAVLLIEQHDFGKGTSSRSTKLVHGGVRYLQQGNIHLVMEALRERGRLLENAPHLVHDLSFVVPAYRWWEAPFYGIGLKLYDWLAGRDRFGASKYLPRREVIRRLPTIRTEGLRGGILYHDGQFDDSRLLLNLLQTAAEHGAVVVNYARVVRLTSTNGKTAGVVVRDEETGSEFTAMARVVVNATGAFGDAIRQMADPAATTMIAPSQGTHLVFDRSFLPGDTAIMVPHTSDERVLFAIPWHGHTLVGTTDVAIPAANLEPRATSSEIDFILETAGRYLAKRPTRADVLSVFVGIRPLAKGDANSITAALSRDHTIRVDGTGLLTIAGGKWTTYRNMAEDCVDQAAKLGQLVRRHCVTKSLHLHGFHEGADSADPLATYGADAAAIRSLQDADPSLATRLHPSLPYSGAEIVWAARHEMARTVEDALSRRTRALFLNAKAARAMAPRVAELLANELGRDAAWQAEQVKAFCELARRYELAD